MKEQTNGERFEEFMKLVEEYSEPEETTSTCEYSGLPTVSSYSTTAEGYPELEGTMNLCNDITEKRTGKMTEEEWQAAEKAQTKKISD